MPILSTLIYLPLIGGIVALLLPRNRNNVVRWTAFGFAAVNLVLAFVLTLLFAQNLTSNYLSNQFEESITWISSLGINYRLHVDGISLLLVLLTTLLTLVCIGASFRVDRKVNSYMAFMLLLESGMLGVFLAGNLFLFYIFWELMLIPAYFLVGSWGGERRIYAAFKFVLYTSVGSLLMLAGIIGVYQAGHSLDIAQLLGGKMDGTLQTWLFLAFAAAFAVKVPFVPFHSWLPDAYSEAPAPVTALLAGAMAKTGTYGFIRICIPLFPQAAQNLSPIFSVLAIVGILYCALMALVQTDIKRILAYSSISHLGVVMLGMFAFTSQGAIGSVLQMVNHGVTIAALFIIAGVIEARTGTRNIRQFGGLATRVPVLATITLIAALSSLGLPGLNSFTGEFLSLIGTFRSNVTFGILGTIVVVPAAWYMMRFFQGIMEGPKQSGGAVGALLRKNTLSDISIGDFLILLPLLALIFYIGLHPAPLTALLGPSVNSVMQNLSVFMK